MMARMTLGAAAIAAAALLMTPASAAPLAQTKQAPAALGSENIVDQARRGGRHFRGGRGFRHFRGGRSFRFRHYRGHRGFRRWHRHRHHRWHRHRHVWGYPFFYYGGYGRSCRYWRHRCAARYGWHTGGYYRCVWRAGC